MKPAYRIHRMVANKGLQYFEDQPGGDVEVYTFDLERKRGKWTVIVPPGKGKAFVPSWTDEERDRIAPRIVEYFTRPIFGLIPSGAEVEFREQSSADVWPPDGQEPRAFRIGLTKRKDAIEYSELGVTLHFSVERQKGAWNVHLPPSLGVPGHRRTLTDDERRRILPRITSYLSHASGLGIFREHRVEFIDGERRPASSAVR